MDDLDDDLKAVKASGLRQRDLCGKVAAKIFIDDAIGCRKESQDVGYEVPLHWQESVPVCVPVCGISREVDLLGSPKGRFGLFVLSCWMGKRTKRLGFAWSSGLGARWPFVLAVLCFDALHCASCVFMAFVVE